MSSPAAQLFAGLVGSAPPDTNPFTLIAYVLYQSLYSPMSDFYMRSIPALHALYAAQALLVIAALAVRWKRYRSDVWLFRLTRTSRGTFIAPHFACAWQLSSLLFVLVLQPYLAMVYEHAVGVDWPGYLGGRSMGYLPAWVSTWLALWSLAVAVCIPRASIQQNRVLGFLSHPTTLNVHFVGGLILCCISIIIPSIIYGHLYDAGINHYRQARDMLVGFEPKWSAMSSAEVDSSLASVVPLVDGMLRNLSTFPITFKVTWELWFAWIVYSYGVFLVVSVGYFTSIRRSMKEIEGLDSRMAQRSSLRVAFRFTALTAVLITVIGFLYGCGALYLAVWTDESLNSKRALELETMGSLYGFGILGLLGSLLSLFQVFLGSPSSTAHDIHISTTSKSLAPSHSAFSGNRVQIQVQTATETEVDQRLSAEDQREKAKDVVQLELSDWKRVCPFDEDPEKASGRRG